MQLRPYQQEALDSIVTNFNNGVKRQLLVLATGLGKTVIAAQLPSVFKDRHPGKMLFIAHTNELIQQAYEKISHWNPTLKVGVEKAENHADFDCDVIVACNASVGRKGSTRLDDFWKDISIVVVDECHHLLADSYLRILEDGEILKEGNTRLLVGLTATPKRHNRYKENDDLVSLKDVFEKITFSYPIRKGIKEGYLSTLKGFRITTETCLDEVKTVAGDFKVDELSKTVNTSERNAQVVKAWREHANYRPTLCFTTDIQHAKDLAAQFVKEGIVAQPVYGDDPLRKEKLSQFNDGTLKVLCNCALLTEGFDSPSVSCIVLARPTKSGSLYTQMVGRGTRLHEGKDSCIVLDICDNYRRCSLVTLPSLVGLSPEFNLKGEELIKTAEAMEDLQEKFPGVDLTDLTDLSKVKAYVESIDILADPFTEDVKNFSKFSWMPQQDGSYMLSIPEEELVKGEYHLYKHERLHIAQNELEEWELKITSVDNERLLWTGNSLQETFSVADDVIRRCRGSRVKLILREAPWHDRPATEPAKRYLRKLLKKTPFPYCLCEDVWEATGICLKCGRKHGIIAGQVQRCISKLQHKKEV